MQNQLREKRKLRALLLVALLIVGAAAGTAMATLPACERNIVTGPLSADLDFRVTAVAVYATGMFYGNPLLAHVEGTMESAGWYTVPLPGFRDPEHVRVRSADATVTAFFNDGESLTFFVADENATFPARVTIDYIAGSAWWTHRYELDLDRADLALVARINWQAAALFHDVDLLLVSGEIHTADPYGRDIPPPRAPEAAGSGGGWFTFSSSDSSSTGGLSAFTVPSSSDAGIYVVHRAEGVDLPGAAGKDAKACRTAGFSLRVYESPINASDLVVATMVQSGPKGGAPATSTSPQGWPAFLAFENQGEVPWVPGLVEVWRDGVLVGSDVLPYTAVGGAASMQVGVSFDIQVERTVEATNTTTFVNYTLRNVDAVSHRLELRELWDFRNTTYDAPFVREGNVLVARVELAPQQDVVIGFEATP